MVNMRDKFLILINLMLIISLEICALGRNGQYVEWYDSYYSNRIAIQGDNLWIAASKGVVKYNTKTGEFYNVSNVLYADEKAKITVVSVAPNGNLVYVDNLQGTYIYDGETTIPYVANMTRGGSFCGLAVAYDSEDKLWVTNCRACVPPNYSDFYYPHYGYVSEQGNTPEMPAITDMEFDSKGNLWIVMCGTYFNLLCIKKGSNQMEYTNNRTIKETTSLSIDENDNVWFADKNGIHCYYTETAKDSVMSNTTHSSIPNEQFYANDIDQNGNIWFVSKNNLLKIGKMGMETYTCSGFNEARSVLCDKGIVWILLKDDKLLKFSNNEFEKVDFSSVINYDEDGSDDQPTGIDLDKNAFAIPIKQSGLNNMNYLTISFWAKVKNFNHACDGTLLLSIRNPEDNFPLSDRGYMWSCISDTFKEGYENQIQIGIREGISKTAISTELSSIELKPMEWKHFAFVFDLVRFNKEILLYVDGVPSYKAIWEKNYTNWNDQYIIMIGGESYENSPLNAYIDKVQIHTLSLTEDEVKEIMTMPLLNDPSTLGYWNFEDDWRIDKDGFLMAEAGNAKATMYKILSNSNEESIGTEIQPFTFGEGVNPESIIQGVEESVTEYAKPRAFVSNGVLYIESEEDITSINIYDSMGRNILTPNPSPVERGVSISLPDIRGVLLVKVNNEILKVIK